MKKIFTLLTFIFLTSAMLIGQCSDFATPNSNHKFFNMDYTLQADRDAALEGLESITYPAGTACMCGDSVTIVTTDLIVQDSVGANDRFRIRAAGGDPEYFGGVNGDFQGFVTFRYMDGSAMVCQYGTTSTSNISDITPIEIYPNPVQDQLTLIDGKGKATIFNAFGQAVKQLTINANQATIQLAGLLDGQYYLRVLQEDGTIVTKQFSKINH